MTQIKTPRLLIVPAEDLKVFVSAMKHSHLSLQPEIYGGAGIDFELTDDQFVLWIKELKTMEAVGGLSIHGADESSGKYEIGYWLKPEACGQGFALEAAASLVETLFERYGAKKLEIRCDSRNEASIRLAKSLGFAPEAVWSGKEKGSGKDRKSLVFARYDAKGLPKTGPREKP